MATIYKAYDPNTSRYVAVKVLPPQFANDPQFIQRFQREAKAIAQLEHLHILPLFTYGEEDGIAYMVMRYMKAGTLSDRIGHGPLPLDEACRLLSQIGSALDHAHNHNILHRDVKPSNILLDSDGNAYLTDFGVAKMVEATLDLTGNRILGTPAYMSPEQCRGEKELTPASDIYSLGIVLYEMVTGRRPFDAETPAAVIMKQIRDPLPPPRTLRPELPEAAERVIFKALAKDPELRYRSAGAMVAEFTKAIAESPSTPPHAPQTKVADHQPDSGTKWGLSRRTWGLLGMLAVILIAAAIARTVIPGASEDLPLAAVTATSLPGAKIPTANSTPTPTPENTSTVSPSPSPTSASAPEISPTAVPVSAPVWRTGDVLFSDDFEDGNAADWELTGAGHWEVVQDEGDNYVLRGEHFIENVGNGNIYADAGDAAWQNYALEVRFRIVEVVSERGRNVAFSVRIDEDRTGCQRYQVNFFETDTDIVRTGDETCSGTAPYVTILDRRTDIELAKGIWYTLRIESYDTYFQVFLDEETILQVDAVEAEPWSGRIQLALGDGTVADFDDVRVVALMGRPTCGPDQRELFFDDFEDGNAAGWNLTPQDEWEIAEIDGSDALLSKGATAAGPSELITPTDYSLQLRLLEASDTANSNIYIRISEESFNYNVNVGHNSLSLNSEYSYGMINWRKRQYVPDDAWHTLRIAVLNNDVTLHWDGQLVAEFNDPGTHEPSGGGFLLESFPDSLVYFDDVLVCDLSRLAADEEGAGNENALFVNAGAAPGGDGSKAAPFSEIQDAIDDAGSASIIRIASGTYDENLRIKGKAASISGGYSPETWEVTGQPDDTVIDGGDRDIAVLIEDGSRVGLDNLTITKGRSDCVNRPGGGGISVRGAATHVTIQRSIIRDNMAESPCGGGGIEAADASVIVLNSWLFDNAANDGAGISMEDASNFVVFNTTIANNQSEGIRIDNEANATGHVLNSILWGNDGVEVLGQLTNAISVLDSIDPLFVNSAVGDYHLRPDSPAVDAGTIEGAPLVDIDGDTRPSDHGVDIGADEVTNGG